MKCPKCAADMETVVFNEIEIDRCTHCFGLWFDQLERDDLKKLEGAESIDIGDEFVGAKYNEVARVECPRCATEMEHILHTEPFDITFESCPACRGSFFDAGEFRDYLDEEIRSQFEAVLEGLNL